jgi:Flp pilus assembly protein TadD
VVIGCTGLGTASHEPVDWAQDNRAEIENAKPEPEPEIEPFTHFAAGQLFESKGNLPEAILQYRKAVDLKPGFVLAYNRLGICLNKTGRFEDAERCFVQALEHGPDAAYLHNNLGFSRMLQKRWSEAADPLHQAVTLQPEFSRARVNLGMTLAHLGQEATAMAQFERAVGTARAYYNMGLVYRNQGRVPEARQAFEKALTLDPHLKRVQENLDGLGPAGPQEMSAGPPAGSGVIPSEAVSAGSPFPDAVATENAPAPLPVLETRGVVEQVSVDFAEAGAGQTVPAENEDTVLSQLRVRLRQALQRQRQLLEPDASAQAETPTAEGPGLLHP